MNSPSSFVEESWDVGDPSVQWMESGQSAGRKPTRAKRRRLMELIIIFGAPWWKTKRKQNKSKWSGASKSNMLEGESQRETKRAEATRRAKALPQLFEFSALTFILNFTERGAQCVCVCVCVSEWVGGLLG